MQYEIKKYLKYKDSGIAWLGDIPEHWEVAPFKKYVNQQIDYRGATPKKVDDGIFLVTAKNIKMGYIDYECSKEFVEPLDYNEIMSRGVPKIGDILFTTEAPLGNISLVDRKDIALAQRVILFRMKSSFIHKFVLFLMISHFFQRQITSLSTGSTAEGIKASKFNQLIFLLPPLSEQEAIAAFLDRETGHIDSLVAKKQRLIELLQEKRTSLISHAVTKGLNPSVRLKPSGIAWLGDIPEHWEVKKLKYILQEPLKYGANESAELDDPELPRFIRITDVDESGNLRAETFRSLPEDIAKMFLLEEGDLLFARSGATVGKTFFYRKTWGKAAYAGYLIRARFKKNIVYPAFLNFISKSSLYSQWISFILIQATIQNVSAEKYASYIIPLPPLAEQEAIAAYLDQETARIALLVSKIQSAIEKLREYRTSLIASAVTGKIDVRED